MGLNVFRAVRGRIRDVAQNQGEEKPKKSLDLFAELELRLFVKVNLV